MSACHMLPWMVVSASLESSECNADQQEMTRNLWENCVILISESFCLDCFIDTWDLYNYTLYRTRALYRSPLKLFTLAIFSNPSLIFLFPLPVQTERVQESWEPLHNQQDGDGQYRKEGENHKEDDWSHIALPLQGNTHHHHPQHLWQLWRDTNDSLSDSHQCLEKIKPRVSEKLAEWRTVCFI